MTRKDYVTIAAVIRAAADDLRCDPSCIDGIASVAARLSMALADDNPRFNPVRFLAACGVRHESDTSQK